MFTLGLIDYGTHVIVWSGILYVLILGSVDFFVGFIVDESNCLSLGATRSSAARSGNASF